MNFGQAVETLKDGKKVARAGWNGKGMFLFYVNGGEFEHDEIGTFESAPYIVMKTADNKIVPWLASQTDVLAENWEIAT